MKAYQPSQSNLTAATIVLAMLTLMLAPMAGAASTRHWTGQADDNWFNPQNWDPTGGPDGSDDLRILAGMPQAATTVDVDAGGSILAHGESAAVTFQDGIVVGRTAEGAMAISGGAAVSNTEAYVGYEPGSSGTVSVDGADSTWTSSWFSYIGYRGEGSLAISNGARVSPNFPSYLGYDDTGVGTVTVDGTGSELKNNTRYYVGYAGTGSLDITDGAAADFSAVFTGHLAGSSGYVTVTGVGTEWRSSSTLVGNHGNGTLTVSDGATAQISGLLAGVGAQSTGTVLVDGEGSSLGITHGLTVGDAGTGALAISDGAVVSGSTATLGYTGSGTVTVDGPGSAWLNSSHLRIGRWGAGTLIVTNAALVTSDQGHVAGLEHASGTIVVDGSGSAWLMAGDLTLGNRDVASLTITGGGAVSNQTAHLGRSPYFATSQGFVTVDGPDSTWTSRGSVFVGGGSPNYQATGRVDVFNGGRVEVEQTLELRPLGTVNLVEGTIRASVIDRRDGGTFNFTGGLLQTASFLGDLANEGGTLSPGLSTGLTVIEGDYIQAAAGRLLVELAGREAGAFDVLVITGLLSLAGTLEVELLDGYMPRAGDSFQVLLFDQLSGEFDHLLLPTLAHDLEWDTTDLYTTGTIMAIPEPASLALLALGGVALLHRRRV